MTSAGDPPSGDPPADPKSAAATPSSAPPVKAEPAKPAAKPAVVVKPVAAKPVAAPDPDDDKPEVPTAPPWWKTLRADPPAHIRLILGIGLIALLLFVWWIATRGPAVERFISPVKMPSPGEVFTSIGSLIDRELSDHTLETLERVFKGVALAAVVGIGVGVLAASHRGVNATLAPLIIFLRSVPMGAMIPLTLTLFGTEEKQKTMFIFLAIVGFVFADTVKAMSIVPERYVETAQTLGASRFQIIRKVLVPLALPDIITSLRFQFGLALGYIMLVEESNAPYGLGKLINGSQRQALSEHVYLLLFVIALIAFTIDLLMRTIQRGAFPWRKDL